MADHARVRDPRRSYASRTRVLSFDDRRVRAKPVDTKSFAQRPGIALATLQWWIAKLRRERKSSVSLVPVRVIASTAPTARTTRDTDHSIEIELKTGVRLRLTTDADLDYVVALAQCLG